MFELNLHQMHFINIKEYSVQGIDIYEIKCSIFYESSLDNENNEGTTT